MSNAVWTSSNEVKYAVGKTHLSLIEMLQLLGADVLRPDEVREAIGL